MIHVKPTYDTSNQSLVSWDSIHGILNILRFLTIWAKFTIFKELPNLLNKKCARDFSTVWYSKVQTFRIRWNHAKKWKKSEYRSFWSFGNFQNWSSKSQLLLWSADVLKNVQNTINGIPWHQALISCIISRFYMYYMVSVSCFKEKIWFLDKKVTSAGGHGLGLGCLRSKWLGWIMKLQCWQIMISNF